MCHYQRIIENHVRNQSFLLQFGSAIDYDLEKFWRVRMLMKNHIRNKWFEKESCSIIEGKFERV